MAGIPELAAGRLSLFADTSSVGRSIGRVFKGGDKEASNAGTRWGSVMAKSFDKAKPDMDKFAADVAKAEKRIADETKRRANIQQLANAKAEAAQAKYNEAVKKSGKDSARAKTAAVQLMTAQNNVAKANLEATESLKKLNRELDDASDAYQKGKHASEAYSKSWRGVGERIGRHLKGEIRHNIDTKDEANEAGDDASEAYSKGWRGLGGSLSYRVVAAIGVAGVAGTIAAKAAGNSAGSAFASGFTSGIGRLSGGRAITDTMKSFGTWVGNLDKSAPKIATVTSAVLTLSGAAVGAIGGLVTLGGSLLSIVPAALVLPGLYMAGAVALGIFSAAMQDAEVYLASAITQFTTLGDQVSGAVWAEAAGPINNLANAVIANLSGSILGASTAMGSLMAAFATEIQGSLPNGELASIIGYLETALWNVHKAVAPLTEALMTLGLVGASYMPALSNWIVQIATDFNTWLQAAEADGRLKGWIDQGIQSLKDLGSVIFHTGAIFVTLSEAFSNAGFDATLGGLAGKLEAVNAALKGPVGQGVLSNIFGGARAALDGVYVGIGNLAGAFVSFAPTLERIMGLGGQFTGVFLSHLAAILENPVFMRGLESFFTGALAGIEALAPAMGPLGTMFGTLAQTIGAFLANLGPVFSEIIQQLAPVFTQVLEAIQPLIPILSNVLLAAFEALMPIIAQLAILFIEHIVPVLKRLSELFIENATWIVPLILFIVGLVATLITLGGWLTAIVTFITGLIGAISFLLPVFAAITPAVLIVIAVIAAIIAIIALLIFYWDDLKRVTAETWDNILTKLQQFGTWFSETFIAPFLLKLDMFKAGWQMARDFVVNAVIWIMSKISQFGTWFINTFVTVFLARLAFFQAGWQIFKNAVALIWQGIRNAIDAIWVWFSTSLVPWFTGKIEFLKIKFGQFRDAVSAVWQAVKNKIYSIYSWFSNNLVIWFADKLTWLQNRWQAFKDRVSNIWTGFKNMLHNGWVTIRDTVFGTLIRSITKDVPNAFERAKDGIGRIWDKIVDKVKAPVRIVVTDVINGGLVAGYNKFNNLWDGKDIAGISLPHGFRKGGYTGNVGKDKIAGVVHGRENVINAEASSSIERVAPGLLGRMNQHGASALPSFGHEGHSRSEGMAAGGPGGPGTYLWGGLQNAIYSSGVAHVTGSAPGFDIGAATRAWNNIGNLNVRHGRGQNQITVGAGAPAGTWGYAWSNGTIRVNAGIPGNRKVGTLAHEIGHVLGLDHAGTNSIMHPMMGGGDWPTAFDRASIHRIYGGAGKGNPPEGGGGFSIFDMVGKVVDFVTKPFNTFKEKFGKNEFGRMGIGIANKAIDGIKSKIGLGGDDSDGGAGLMAPTLYDKGGLIPKGIQLIDHQRNQPDRVLTAEQWRIQERNAKIVSENANGQNINLYMSDVPWRDPDEAATRIVDKLSFALQGS